MDPSDWIRDAVVDDKPRNAFLINGKVDHPRDVAKWFGLDREDAVPAILVIGYITLRVD